MPSLKPKKVEKKHALIVIIIKYVKLEKILNLVKISDGLFKINKLMMKMEKEKFVKKEIKERTVEQIKKWTTKKGERKVGTYPVKQIYFYLNKEELIELNIGEKNTIYVFSEMPKNNGSEANDMELKKAIAQTLRYFQTNVNDGNLNPRLLTDEEKRKFKMLKDFVEGK